MAVLQNPTLSGDRIIGHSHTLKFKDNNIGDSRLVRLWYKFDGEGDDGWREVKVTNGVLSFTPSLSEWAKSPQNKTDHPIVWTWVNAYDGKGGITKIGQNIDYWNFKLPSSAFPSITKASPYSTASDSSVFVEQYTQLKVDVNGTLQYGAIAKAYWLEMSDSSGKILHTYNYKSIASPNVILDCGVLEHSGRLTLKVSLQDSRNSWSPIVTKTINVIGYDPSVINGTEIRRCDRHGNITESGTYAKVSADYKAFTPGNNTAKLTVYYREWKATDWNFGGSSTVSGEGRKTFTINGNFDLMKNYQIKFELKDAFETAECVELLRTELTVLELHHSGKGITFGGVAEREGFNVFFPTRIYNERGYNPATIQEQLAEAMMKFGAELKLNDGVQESLQEWVMLVNQCLIKLANTYASPLELRQPMISLKWDDTFTPEKDGFCMIAVDPSSSNCRAKITNTDSNTYIYDSGIRGNASEFRHWFPITGGYTYRLEGQNAKTVKISYQYLRR